MLDACFEVFIGKAANPFDKIFGAGSGNVLAGEDTVDEHAQLCILKFPIINITACPARFYSDSGFFQQRDIAADSLSFNCNTVVAFQMTRNILLCHRMLMVAVFLEDLPYSD